MELINIGSLKEGEVFYFDTHPNSPSYKVVRNCVLSIEYQREGVNFGSLFCYASFYVYIKTKIQIK